MRKILVFSYFILLSSCLSSVYVPDRYYSFADTAEIVLPSVVHIRAVDKKEQLIPEGWDFFYNPFTPSPETPFSQKKEYFDEGMGAGVIVARDQDKSYVVTNYHVVAESDTIMIRMHDGTVRDGFIAGIDKRKDIALLYFIDSSNTSRIIKIGDSDTLRIGDWVLAIGSPYGYDSSVSAGIVSALGRRAASGDNISDFIQTDAAINTGNSGGALVNVKGELVGINSWITTPTGGSIGLGFSIPVNNIKKTINDIIMHGEVRYGWIGIIAGDLSEYETELFNPDRLSGVFVFQTIYNDPAYISDILPGDFLLEVNGKKISDLNTFMFLIGEAGEGGTASVKLIRDNVIIDREIILGRRESNDIILEQNKRYWPGISVLTVDEKFINISSDIRKGVIVSQVESRAIVDFLQIGDIIYEINGIPVADTSDFYNLISQNINIISLRFYRNNVDYYREANISPQG